MTLPLQFYSLNFNPSAPIPNGNFTSPNYQYLQGPWYPLVVGTGLTVDLTTATISASGGGGGTPATPSVEGTVFGLTEPVSGATFNVALGEIALSALSGGVGNTAIGTSAGNLLTTGSFNTYIGSGSGSFDGTGTNNIALGFNTLNGFDGGSSNVVIGWGAGSTLTNESGNVILGGYTGQAGLNDHVFLASGTGTLRVTINDQGAIAFDGTNYGTSGNVLTSSGTTGAPQWVTGASGSFTAGAQTITVTNGIITSIV